ncbi:bacteriohemerythrin [Marinoscillum pacificum]|uniref:bacteriohemerythrin n=1 Tax=Marinoscillum pacificum TaxID=392723 RepID=UPI00215748D7|nr:hemerythrin family protein [Marinoscillum pacificum]
MVKWEQRFETGFEEVDEQHQSLFNYINDLEECINDKYFEGARIEIILNFFQMFCATHFSLEESCMLREHCPAYEKNKEAHGKFLEYYKKFRVNYKPAKNKEELLKEFHGVLIKWLVNHIMKIDMNLKKAS